MIPLFVVNWFVECANETKHSTNIFRVATHLENLENREKSGNLRVFREKSGKKKKAGKRQGKCVLAYGQLPRVLILTQNVEKRNYLLGKVVHHMKSETRKDACSARCKLCLKTFSLSNMVKHAVVSYAKSSGHVRNVAEKSGKSRGI